MPSDPVASVQFVASKVGLAASASLKLAYVLPSGPVTVYVAPGIFKDVSFVLKTIDEPVAPVADPCETVVG
ncbi:hypothetical protein FQP82_02185 [Weissella cibaria]|uniref:hypothetical protein n=1 Tax=Weissella cibaria TaxID=137591 RepID=UPI0011960598|nr:hypothetical protein [Weissella cibaria]TVV18557.1 hypothetical protein FQP82_02185 [Weissella cibaria]UJF02598.1 hypothetical protein L1O50_02235 [Weissella cibaria]